MKTESRFVCISVMVGHEVLLKATSGPRHKKRLGTTALGPRGTLEISNRSEIYIHVFLFPNTDTYVSEYYSQKPLHTY